MSREFSSRERREADLFFAALMGRPQASTPRQTESWPDALAEQPAPAAVPLPASIVTKWTGVDRSSIPRHVVAGNTVGDTGWMGTLIDNSNLRFTGAYVSGPALAGIAANHFTNS